MNRLDQLTEEYRSLNRRWEEHTITASEYCRRLTEIGEEFVALLEESVPAQVPPELEAVAK